jgi:hypothetical protein
MGESYADQFNAPSWLEGPAQWLWWAMQSRIAGNLTDAQYNLAQFWKALDTVKATASDATWPEIMALDSQSQLQSANITSAIINQMEQDVSTVSAWLGVFGWSGTDAKTAIAKLQDQRTAALASAANLAAQANTAVATRAAGVASGRISQDDAQRAQENTDVNNIIKANSTLSIGGVPLWALGLGAAALLFLLRGR